MCLKEGYCCQVAQPSVFQSLGKVPTPPNWPLRKRGPRWPLCNSLGQWTPVPCCSHCSTETTCPRCPADRRWGNTQVSPGPTSDWKVAYSPTHSYLQPAGHSPWNSTKLKRFSPLLWSFLFILHKTSASLEDKTKTCLCLINDWWLQALWKGQLNKRFSSSKCETSTLT